MISRSITAVHAAAGSHTVGERYRAGVVERADLEASLKCDAGEAEMNEAITLRDGDIRRACQAASNARIPRLQ